MKWENYDESKPQILSMGWGVQTVGMLIMIEKGILPKPDLIIHSDTGAEKPETILYKEHVGIPLIEKLGIEYFEVKHQEGIIEDYMKKGIIPLAGFRSCTSHYKIQPLLIELRKRYFRKGLKKPIFQTWIGISKDEIRRKIERENQEPQYQEMIYPFLDLDMSRRDIIEMIESSEYDLPIKSGCFICPYQGLRGFLELKEKHRDLFKIAVKMENNYFDTFPDREYGFLVSSKIRLKTLNEMKSLFSYEKIENEMNECDSGGCFL